MENKIYLNKYLPKYNEHAKESIGFGEREETHMFFDRASLYLKEGGLDSEILNRYTQQAKKPEDESLPGAMRKDELEVRPHVENSVVPVLTHGLYLVNSDRIVMPINFQRYISSELDCNIDFLNKYFYIILQRDHVLMYLLVLATEMMIYRLNDVILTKPSFSKHSQVYYNNTVLWRIYQDWRYFGFVAQKGSPSPRLHTKGIRNYYRSLSYTKGIAGNFYKGSISLVVNYITNADYEQLHGMANIFHHYWLLKGSSAFYGAFLNYIKGDMSKKRAVGSSERNFLADPGTKDIYDISSTPSRGRLDWRMYMQTGRFLAGDAFYSPVDSALQSEMEWYKQGLDDVLVKKEKGLEPRHWDNIVFHVMGAYSLYDLEYKYDVRYYPVRSIVDNFMKYYGRPSGGYVFPDEHGHDQTRIFMEQYWKATTDYGHVNFTDRPYEYNKPNGIFPHHFTGFVGDYSTKLDYPYAWKERVEGGKKHKYKRLLGGKKNRKVSRYHPFKRLYDHGIMESKTYGYESQGADILF